VNQPAHQLQPRFDSSDPDFLADPYATYAKLRKAGRVCRGGLGQLVVTRYADVDRLLANNRLGSQFPPAYYALAAGEGPARDFLERIVLHRDGALHRRLRKLIARHFSSAAQARLVEGITRILDGMIENCRGSGMLEIVGNLALPLPARVMFMIMGIPEKDYEILLPKVMLLGSAFTSSLTHERDDVNEAVVWLRLYVRDLLQKRGADPREDLLSHLSAGGGDEFDQDEVVDNAIFLLFAGFETTSCVLANGWALLLRNPDQLARLAADPTLVPLAVEEFIRYEAPIQSRLRIVKEPIEIDGREIRPGRLLLLLIGSANRDERQFERPDELDIARTPNRHLSFGGGEHYCLGASLAQLECQLAFDYLVSWFDGFEAVGEPVRRSAGPFRTYDRINMRIQAKTRWA
jgi:cytochrome P450